MFVRTVAGSGLSVIVDTHVWGLGCRVQGLKFKPRVEAACNPQLQQEFGRFLAMPPLPIPTGTIYLL